MPIVSPGGIVTPADSDGWDLTTDLATMATSIDSAVSAANAGANAFKGTASDRGLFTSTATDGMLWQDTNSLKMIWRKDGAQWVPAVWRWAGSASQMNSFAAPNGFEWYNTTDDREYVRVGGAWGAGVGVPFATAAGLLGNGTIPGGGQVVRPITFPPGRFTDPPVLNATTYGSGVRDVATSVANVTVSGADIIMGSSGSVARTAAVTWFAVQMTPTSGVG